MDPEPLPNPQCVISTPCCGNLLPSSLVAQWDLSAGLLEGCICALNGVVPLNFDDELGAWRGRVTFGTCVTGDEVPDVIFTFSCGGTDCTGFILEVSFSDECTASIFDNDPCTCSCGPSATFGAFGCNVIDVTACCTGSQPNNMFVEIQG